MLVQPALKVHQQIGVTHKKMIKNQRIYNLATNPRFLLSPTCTAAIAAISGLVTSVAALWIGAGAIVKI